MEELKRYHSSPCCRKDTWQDPHRQYQEQNRCQAEKRTVNEWQATLHLNFVDFEKTFDAVHHESLWLIMEQYGIPGKIVMTIKTFYEDFQCTLEDQGEMCEWFNINSGVKRMQRQDFSS